MALGLTASGNVDAITGLLGQTLYAALHTADPSQATPSEISGTDYARVEVASGNWTIDSTTGVGSNNVAIDWGTAGSDWGDVTHVAFWDAATGGNLKFDDALPATVNVRTNDEVQSAADSITVTFATVV